MNSRCVIRSAAKDLYEKVTVPSKLNGNETSVAEKRRFQARRGFSAENRCVVPPLEGMFARHLAAYGNAWRLIAGEKWTG